MQFFDLFQDFFTEWTRTTGRAERVRSVSIPSVCQFPVAIQAQSLRTEVCAFVNLLYFAS